MGRRRQHNPRYKLMLKRLRRVRRENGLTQAEVARALGTTQAYVSKSESGERRIDAVELYDFARAYGEPLETLLPPSKVRRRAGEGSHRGGDADPTRHPGPSARPRPKRSAGSKPE